MIWIPAGSFVMGSPTNELGRWSDEVQHTVTISQPFFIAKTETTEWLWDIVRDQAISFGYTDLPPGRASSYNDDWIPVTDLSWYDVVKWCNLRSETEGRAPAYRVNGKVYRAGKNDSVVCNWSVNGYRLPTEAEWEYACRAGTTTAFCSGPIIETYSGLDPNLNQVGWYWNNSTSYFFSLIGRKYPNAWKLYDMHGNMAEWCWDWYRAYDLTHTTDPTGPATGTYRMLRGGSWASLSAGFCRSAMRNLDSPQNLSSNPSSQYGFRTVISAPGTGDWKPVVEAQPTQPTYSTGPVKLQSKKNLIVVTHGWQPRWDSPDVAWVDAMTNQISRYLTSRGLTDWTVLAYKWTEKAHTILPNDAVEQGWKEGLNLGKVLAPQGWDHIHLIAHSAGASLIQGTCDILKSSSLKTTVHLTFLDAYTGFSGMQRSYYGYGADWCDSYFSHDFWTSGEIAPYTEGPLEHARNINVTYLDGNKSAVQVFASSTLGGANQYCYQTASSHGWPYEFYQNTIPPNSQTGAGGYGFLLSKEGGGWSTATNQYKARGNTPTILGTPDPTCAGVGSSTTPTAIGISTIDPGQLGGFKSDTGTVIFDAGGRFELLSGSPVWQTTFLLPLGRANIVSFQVEFTSDKGAQGLLSVYWGTNLLVTIDERLIPAGLYWYTLPIPLTGDREHATLSFRLDPFGSIRSHVAISQIWDGEIGIQGDVHLLPTGELQNGRPILQLTAPAGFNYTIESSTDLISWNPFAVLVNTSGSVRFIDSTGTAKARFYRAIAP